MRRTKLTAAAVLLCLGLLAATRGIGADPPNPVLPPGWTEADMQACMLAGTPGEMHAYLTRDVGNWQGKNTMWMAPGSEPVTTDCTAEIKPILGGRYTECHIKGEIPGMGPYNGIELYGYDNVSKQFVSNWIDDHSTGIMFGTGKLSPDGTTLSWELTYNCPVTQKPAKMRQIEKMTGPNSKTIESFGADPKSGVEFQMMKIEMTRK